MKVLKQFLIRYHSVLSEIGELLVSLRLPNLDIIQREIRDTYEPIDAYIIQTPHLSKFIHHLYKVH